MTGQECSAGVWKKATDTERQGTHPACRGLPATAGARRRRGGGLVEFTLVAFLLFVTVLAVFDFSRMLLVYSSVAHAARVAVHYATVNGAFKGTPATQSSVCGVVTSYATAVNKNAFTCGGSTGSYIAVSWTASGSYAAHQPGSLVQVTVVYQYDPFFSYLPLNVKLGSTAQGYISF